MAEASFYESRLAELCGSDSFRKDEKMSEHTTFRTGGPADYYVIPKDRETFIRLVQYLRQSEREFLILGRCSNVLVSDRGYRGTVIDTTSMNRVSMEGDEMWAEAGAMLGTVAGMAARASLSGLEFASGIPGTLGGAVFMNAGAYGGEMAQIVTEVEVMDPSGQIISIYNKEMEFGYRTSIVQRMGFPVLSVRMKLEAGDPDEIQGKMRELAEKRKEKQPLDQPSAGSTFKRPEGYFAAKLITDAGLSGMRVGGAVVSPRHNGFIVNDDNASSADIMDLIGEVRERVKQRFGVELEPEVRLIGDF